MLGAAWLWERLHQLRPGVKPTGSVQQDQIKAEHQEVEVVADAYWKFLRRHTLGMVRPCIDQGGIDLRILGITFIHLGAPTIQEDANSHTISWPIQRGLLVAYPGGWFSFQLQSSPNTKLQMRLEGFRPSLPVPLYYLLEQQLHRCIGQAFIRSLASNR